MCADGVCRVNQYVRTPLALKKLSVDLINIESCLAQLSTAVDLSCRQFSEIFEEIPAMCYTEALSGPPSISVLFSQTINRGITDYIYIYKE